MNLRAFSYPLLVCFVLMMVVNGPGGGKVYIHVGVFHQNSCQKQDSSDSVSHDIRAVASSRLIWIFVLLGRLQINETKISVENMDQNVPFGCGVKNLWLSFWSYAGLSSRLVTRVMSWRPGEMVVTTTVTHHNHSYATYGWGCGYGSWALLKLQDVCWGPTRTRTFLGQICFWLVASAINGEERRATQRLGEP